MNRIICAVIAAGLLAAAPFARAEEGAKAGKDGDRKGRREAMLKERLGLSDDQASKLKAAWEAEKAAVKPLREQAKETSRKLEEQVRGLASDKDIQATLDSLDAGRKAMMAEHQKLESTMASVLKPNQRAKLRLLMAHRMKGHGRWGRHGKGGRGHEGHRGGDREHHDD